MSCGISPRESASVPAAHGKKRGATVNTMTLCWQQRLRVGTRFSTSPAQAHGLRKPLRDGVETRRISESRAVTHITTRYYDTTRRPTSERKDVQSGSGRLASTESTPVSPPQSRRTGATQYEAVRIRSDRVVVFHPV